VQARTGAEEPVVAVRDLAVGYHQGRHTVSAVSGVSLAIKPGEIAALVGESGSGKSTIAHAIGGLLPPSGSVVSGSIVFRGRDITSWGPRLRLIRGRQIGFVSQDPMVSLDPVQTIGRQVAEVYAVHKVGTRADRPQRAADALAAAGLPDPGGLLGKYPHELSGGMRQRVQIAIALALDPSLLIADEPTTALDATIQRQILNFIARAVAERGAGLLLITHDLGLAADYADTVTVMSRGQVVESGPARTVVAAPSHPYTARLLRSSPLISRATPAPNQPAAPETGDDPMITATDLVKVFRGRGRRAKDGGVRAVDGVSFDVARGESVGLVGESGSGKSTLARLVLMLERPDSGDLRIDGQDVTGLSARDERAWRRRIQLVYQNPYASLDPRMNVADAITEPLVVFGVGDAAEREKKAAELLDRVSLPLSIRGRRPAELSGGQRQRVAIARALAISPEILVCDEPVSALDVTVQAQILELIREFQDRLRLTVIFISHDLAVVRQVCQRVVVMRSGRVVESGSAEDVFSSPEHPYTQELLAAVPGARLLALADEP
jgi:peptide/nickel transport system ATP-binding protein